MCQSGATVVALRLVAMDELGEHLKLHACSGEKNKVIATLVDILSSLGNRAEEGTLTAVKRTEEVLAGRLNIIEGRELERERRERDSVSGCCWVGRGR